jgi:hypothetical protein
MKTIKIRTKKAGIFQTSFSYLCTQQKLFYKGKRAINLIPTAVSAIILIIKSQMVKPFSAIIRHCIVIN